MTPQEAREILSKINISVGMGESFNLSENQILEATSMAIEALEQQSCEDCISRTEALKAIEEEKQGWESGETRYAIDGCHTRIAELPSVDDITAWMPLPEFIEKVRNKNMEKKRILTADELDRIHHEEDMLKGNINRMCVADDSDELVKMFHFANLRIKTIYDICLDKFLDDKESESE